MSSVWPTCLTAGSDHGKHQYFYDFSPKRQRFLALAHHFRRQNIRVSFTFVPVALSPAHVCIAGRIDALRGSTGLLFAAQAADDHVATFRHPPISSQGIFVIIRPSRRRLDVGLALALLPRRF